MSSPQTDEREHQSVQEVDMTVDEVEKVESSEEGDHNKKDVTMGEETVEEDEEEEDHIADEQPHGEDDDEAEDGKNVVDVEEEEEEEEEEASLSLPLSKIKKIFKLDPEYTAASPGAVYATGLATELFIQYFVEQASMSAKMDKRKKIQYKDFSSAVSHNDALTFLRDTVPKTQELSALISKNIIDVNGQPGVADMDTMGSSTTGEQEDVEEVQTTTHSKPLAKGQQTLNFGRATPQAKAVDPAPVAPIKKAVLSDLMSEDQDEEEVIMID
ncbi:DNA polymerase epsilon subunit C [[Candida] anglica]